MRDQLGNGVYELAQGSELGLVSTVVSGRALDNVENRRSGSQVTGHTVPGPAALRAGRSAPVASGSRRQANALIMRYLYTAPV